MGYSHFISYEDFGNWPKLSKSILFTTARSFLTGKSVSHLDFYTRSIDRKFLQLCLFVVVVVSGVGVGVGGAAAAGALGIAVGVGVIVAVAVAVAV